MRVDLWGTRGSVASPGPETIRYGGNTSCVGVEGKDGTLLSLDAGTGLRRLGMAIEGKVRRIDILLTHLHLDHIQGLGFFKPLFDRDVEVHIWGPPSTTARLHTRLSRYLSPPLFPVRLRELDCLLTLHDLSSQTFDIGPFEIETALVCHPGPTLGYRIREGGKVLAYLPDHEPALGKRRFPDLPEWTSGWDLIRDADLLIHDSQFFGHEIGDHLGWGHSSLDQTVALAEAAGVRRLVPFHHDPAHTDSDLEASLERARAGKRRVDLLPGAEGSVFEV